MHINAQTRPVALLGYPVEHSLSPLLHNTAFQEQELNYVYVALPVSPDDLQAAVEGLKALGFAGANVTIPHKQAVLPLVDELSPQAEAVGAVNTIVCRRDEETGRVSLLGDNTDVVGFLEPLLEYAEQLEGASMLLLGGGGAARAVAYALLSTFRPERLTLAVRSPERAAALVEDLAAYDETKALQVVPLTEARPHLRKSKLIVNATPLGMSPHLEGTPWETAEDFSEEHIVYDLVYNPEETRLLREAAAQGAATIGGLEMLISQAAAAYAEWTNEPMPVSVVRKALRKAAKF